MSINLWGIIMTEPMIVRLNGTRGSRVTSQLPYQAFGTDTSSVTVSKGDDNIILDTGSGISNYSEFLIEQAGGIENYQRLPPDSKRYSVLHSHFHKDHLVDLDSFQPVYMLDVELRFFSPALLNSNRRGKFELVTSEFLLSTLMGGSEYPVRFSEADRQNPNEPFLQCKKEFFPITAYGKDVKEGIQKLLGRELLTEFKVGKMLVMPFELDHPGGAVGYRIEDTESGATVAYVTDTVHRPGKVDHNILNGIEGADLVIYDSSMAPDGLDISDLLKNTPTEFHKFIDVRKFSNYPHYGHSDIESGATLAQMAHAIKLIGFHHEPHHSDIVIRYIEQYIKRKCPDVDVDMAVQGSVLSVEKGRVTYLKKPPVEEIIQQLHPLYLKK